MSKTKTLFVCQKCGYESVRWLGKCPSCGEWNSLVETVVSTKVNSLRSTVNSQEKPQRLAEIKSAENTRISTGIEEFDRVLGGGLVPGSVILLAGDPGIGKSTLMLQLADKVANLLYISGEESPQQIKIRAERLKIKGDNLLLLPETDVDLICAQIEKEKPVLTIIDSIQTLVTTDLSGTAGSIGQVRESATRLAKTGKDLGIPIFLIGHVTKEGAIAGPMVLEHLVDVVLFLEGERFYPGRTLRSFKNRFGPTDEVGIFRMEERGLAAVENPSELFLKESQQVPGSVIVPILEGTRPLLVEVQALVNRSVLAYPRRVASGFDPNRLSLLTAIISRRLGLPLGNWDVFVNIPGGLKVREPAADLGVALAVISSFRNKSLPKGSFAFGEVGLLGEVRRVLGEEKRIKEAKRLGFTQVISPQTCSSLAEVVLLLK